VIATWASSLEGGVVLEVVPFHDFALAWKAAKFLEPDSTALAEKTAMIPLATVSPGGIGLSQA